MRVLGSSREGSVGLYRDPVTGQPVSIKTSRSHLRNDLPGPFRRLLESVGVTDWLAEIFATLTRGICRLETHDKELGAHRSSAPRLDTVPGLDYFLVLDRADRRDQFTWQLVTP